MNARTRKARLLARLWFVARDESGVVYVAARTRKLVKGYVYDHGHRVCPTFRPLQARMIVCPSRTSIQ